MFSIPKNSQALFKDIGLVFQKLTFLDFTISQYNNIAVFGFWLVSEVTQIYETFTHVMLCAIWYHLYNFKNAKNIQGGVLLLVKLHAEGCNFIKSNIPPWMFFKFFKFYKWHQIGQDVSYARDLWKRQKEKIYKPMKFIFF